MEPDIYLTIRHVGRAVSNETLAAFVQLSLEEPERKPSLLCYCHQLTGAAWEAPCAKLRAELGLHLLFPLAFGHSGCLSFAHALALTKWLLASGSHREALFVIAELSEVASSADESVKFYNVAIIEASRERGVYQDLRSPSANPAFCLETQQMASEPFLDLKGCEPLLAPGAVVELAFWDGDEKHAITLRKE
ncbi:hypothetical protein BBD42_24890 [Paenibacillus sp. BIHB 4019]|uniref:Uncharacterized protein n=1 Tax=Paenibacillus sp. BIHB 4019 TaxID=1870819 RepID=A0A1B2DNS7_9BACL|nr:hypothetical protein [Paenibacillus sp. BIHB 4019]ANY69357.1 hypothetical protein BBD42_24890 [Paenibacillus sp. BIHB 4019]